MLTRPKPDKKNLILSLLCLSMTTILCISVYLIATAFIIDPTDLQLFRYQLIFVTIVFFVLSISTILLAPKIIRKFTSSPIPTKITAPVSRASSSYPIDNSTTRLVKGLQEQSVLTALAVDDNPANLLIINKHLENHFMDILLADNGEEAIRLYEKHLPDIIFMDIEMAGMDGYSTTKAIRAIEKQHFHHVDNSYRSPRKPIIAVSAHHHDDKRLEALSIGFDDYIVKPITQEEFKKVVSRWTQIEQPTQEHSNTVLEAQHEPAVIPLKSNSHSITTRKIVDIEKSLEHSNHNPVLARDMLQLLIKMISDEKNNLIHHYQEQDWPALYQLNHKIYGGSSYCGVPQLQKLNQQLERLLLNKVNFSSNKESGLENSIDEASIEQDKTKLKKLFDNLLESIDELITWNEEHDIDIIFNIDN